MSVDAITLAAKALDGLHIRSAAIAYNLANAGSPRFQALEVNFEDALRQAAQEGPKAVGNLEITFTAGRIFGPGEERREDLMLVDASQNAMRYAALADMTGRRFAMLSAAIGAR
ncbi:flagellar basal body rod protein FlgB [Novosphingobium sp.]|uniref:flagellar basal body rod protein FlgB n=1 Tax=Novosphingobium sp. TaxID=1874826 RepID=UPI0035B21535